MLISSRSMVAVFITFTTCFFFSPVLPLDPELAEADKEAEEAIKSSEAHSKRISDIIKLYGLEGKEEAITGKGEGKGYGEVLEELKTKQKELRAKPEKVVESVGTKEPEAVPTEVEAPVEEAKPTEEVAPQEAPVEAKEPVQEEAPAEIPAKEEATVEEAPKVEEVVEAPKTVEEKKVEVKKPTSKKEAEKKPVEAKTVTPPSLPSIMKTSNELSSEKALKSLGVPSSLVSAKDVKVEEKEKTTEAEEGGTTTQQSEAYTPSGTTTTAYKETQGETTTGSGQTTSTQGAQTGTQKQTTQTGASTTSGYGIPGTQTTTTATTQQQRSVGKKSTTGYQTRRDYLLDWYRLQYNNEGMTFIEREILPPEGTQPQQPQQSQQQVSVLLKEVNPKRLLTLNTPPEGTQSQQPQQPYYPPQQPYYPPQPYYPQQQYQRPPTPGEARIADLKALEMQLDLRKDILKKNRTISDPITLITSLTLMVNKINDVVEDADIAEFLDTILGLPSFLSFATKKDPKTGADIPDKDRPVSIEFASVVKKTIARSNIAPKRLPVDLILGYGSLLQAIIANKRLSRYIKSNSGMNKIFELLEWDFCYNFDRNLKWTIEGYGLKTPIIPRIPRVTEFGKLSAIIDYLDECYSDPLVPKLIGAGKIKKSNAVLFFDYLYYVYHSIIAAKIPPKADASARKSYDEVVNKFAKLAAKACNSKTRLGSLVASPSAKSLSLATTIADYLRESVKAIKITVGIEEARLGDLSPKAAVLLSDVTNKIDLIIQLLKDIATENKYTLTDPGKIGSQSTIKTETTEGKK